MTNTRRLAKKKARKRSHKPPLRRGGRTNKRPWLGGSNYSKIDLFIGSSSVSMFKLMENDNVVIKKLGGVPMLSLIKPNNLNRQKVIETISNHTPGDIGKLIFCFGECDVHLGYYYNLLFRKLDLLTDINKNFKTVCALYLSFVSSFKYVSDEVFVIGPFPNVTLNNTELLNKLINYEVVYADTTLESIPQSIKRRFTPKTQIEVFHTVNNILKDECHTRGIKYVDVAKVCLTPQGVVRKDLINVHNKLNIHLNWEPMIEDICKAVGYKNVQFKEELSVGLNRFQQQRKVHIDERLMIKIQRTAKHLRDRTVKNRLTTNFYEEKGYDAGTIKIGGIRVRTRKSKRSRTRKSKRT